MIQVATQTIGLAVIAKDEEDTLPRLLASVEGAFDQVALLDTGSTDRTVEVFEDWAAAETERHPRFVSTLGHFKWCDDFAAARNASYELLETDWCCQADCDDEILDAELLREKLEDPEVEEVDAFAFPYFWRLDIPAGERIRITRRGESWWEQPLHENLTLRPRDGQTAVIRNIFDFPAWRHRPDRRSRDDLDRQFERNARILHSWQQREPDNDLPDLLLRWEYLFRTGTIKGTDIPLAFIEAHTSDRPGPELRCCTVCPHGCTGSREEGMWIREVGGWSDEEVNFLLGPGDPAGSSGDRPNATRRAKEELRSP